MWYIGQQNGGATLKKFRGKKRYFRKLWSSVENYQTHVDDNSWYDYWHRHLDFFGLGNDSLQVRRAHIKAHISLYTRILTQLEQLNKPYQTWVCIHDEDTGSDAVYIHTPNPNSDDFPAKFDFLKWDCKLPNAFSDLIDKTQFNIGYYESELERVYYIQSKHLKFPISN